MGERKGQNKYYPPDFDPSKGSLNSFLGVHALRERGKKAHLGIITIRFEMPFSIWCEGCGNHIGRGVRYNAEKKKTGNYYSTPIYLFKMRCHLCQQYFEIQTDPKNFDYELISGCKRQERRWEPAEGEMVQATEKEEKKKIASDPMYKLEHNFKDASSAKTLESGVDALYVFQSRSRDDYAANKALRASLRTTKKEAQSAALTDQGILDKNSLALKLVPEHEDDRKLASLLAKFGTRKSIPEATVERRKRIADGDIFTGNIKSRKLSVGSSSRRSDRRQPSSSLSKQNSVPNLEPSSTKRGALFSRSLAKRKLLSTQRQARSTMAQIAQRTARNKLDTALRNDRSQLVKLQKSINLSTTIAGSCRRSKRHLSLPSRTTMVENRFSSVMVPDGSSILKPAENPSSSASSSSCGTSSMNSTTSSAKKFHGFQPDPEVIDIDDSCDDQDESPHRMTSDDNDDVMYCRHQKTMDNRSQSLNDDDGMAKSGGLVVKTMIVASAAGCSNGGGMPNLDSVKSCNDNCITKDRLKVSGFCDSDEVGVASACVCSGSDSQNYEKCRAANSSGHGDSGDCGDRVVIGDRISPNGWDPSVVGKTIDESAIVKSVTLLPKSLVSMDYLASDSDLSE